MFFSQANIDRAILITQFDLRGFAHPLGFRTGDDKSFCAIAPNFIAFAIRGLQCAQAFTNLMDKSYEDCLQICKQLASHSDHPEHEAIQLIIKDIVLQSDMRKSRTIGKRLQDPSYLFPLERDNTWGKVVLALAEAFDVTILKNGEVHIVEITPKCAIEN